MVSQYYLTTLTAHRCNPSRNRSTHRRHTTETKILSVMCYSSGCVNVNVSQPQDPDLSKGLLHKCEWQGERIKKKNSNFLSNVKVNHFAACASLKIKYFFSGTYKLLTKTNTHTQADGLTLTPMKRSLSTIQDSRKTKALLQQKSADTSVVLIFLRACRYR